MVSGFWNSTSSRFNKPNKRVSHIVCNECNECLL
jgi:hypothetical protein